MDLRYLASKRVLVLVDGRRWVKGSSGSGVSGAVDLNSIPASAIKSIEILQDGASAIYGSDAIGGVLNIITADDYDTFKISGYTGQYGEGDGETSEFDMRMGGNGERGRALVSMSYVNQKEVNTADRSTSEFPLPGFPFGISSGTPAGRFVFFDPAVGDFVSVTPETTNPVYTPGNGAGDDFHDFALEDRFNYQPYNHLVTPNERFNVFAKGEYDISDNVSFRRTRQLQQPQVAGSCGAGAALLRRWTAARRRTWSISSCRRTTRTTRSASTSMAAARRRYGQRAFLHQASDRGRPAHLQPGRRHLVPVRRLRGRFRARRPHDVLGRDRHPLREQRQADQAQPVQRPHAERGHGRSGGLRR